MFLKRFKPAYELYNLFHKKELKHNLPLYRKYGLKKKYFSSVSFADFKGLEQEVNIHDKLNSAQELQKQEAFNNLDTTTQEAMLSWSDKGYVILKKHLSTKQVDEINLEVEKIAKIKRVKWQHKARIMFGIHHSSLLKSIGEDAKLKNILKLLLGRDIELFQSINFLNASQQRSHSDSIHMSTFPQGNIIAVWIALEDIDEENGPLHYYPGSHKLPYVMNADFGNHDTSLLLGNKSYGDYEDAIAQLIEQHQLQKQTFHAKKGDILIWHANLLHGGERLLNPNRTRKSMVLHYYAKNVFCYHEISQRPTLKK